MKCVSCSGWIMAGLHVNVSYCRISEQEVPSSSVKILRLVAGHNVGGGTYQKIVFRVFIYPHTLKTQKTDYEIGCCA
jgi:hypothetical protein